MSHWKIAPGQGIIWQLFDSLVLKHLQIQLSCVAVLLSSDCQSQISPKVMHNIDIPCQKTKTKTKHQIWKPPSQVAPPLLKSHRSCLLPQKLQNSAYESVGHRTHRFPEPRMRIYGRAETISISGTARTGSRKSGPLQDHLLNLEAVTILSRGLRVFLHCVYFKQHRVYHNSTWHILLLSLFAQAAMYLLNNEWILE